MTADQIAQEIWSYIQRFGGAFGEWYVGVARSPRDRLFGDHCVDERGAWIYGGCVTSAEARAVEDYFIQLGMKGGSGGGDGTTKAVYAYRITWATRE